MQHCADAIRGQCGTSDGIHLRVGILHFLDDRESHLAVIAIEMLPLEFLLPFPRVFYLRSKSGSLALMIEVSTIYRLSVLVYGKIATYAAPQSHTFHGKDIFSLAAYLAHIDSGIIHYVFLLHHFGISLLSLLAVQVSYVQRVQYLLLLVKSHVGILPRLQRLRHESKEESHNHHKNG